jgi:hypothetical protein
MPKNQFYPDIPLADRAVRRRQYRFDLTFTVLTTLPLDEIFETTHTTLQDRLKLLWRMIRTHLEGVIHTEFEKVKVFRLKALGEEDRKPHIDYR